MKEYIEPINIQSSSNDSVLNGFMNKSNQSFESFKEQFDYLSDESIQIKSDCVKKRSIKKAIFTLNVNNKSNENSQEFSSSVLDAQDENSNSNINAEDLIETIVLDDADRSRKNTNKNDEPFEISFLTEPNDYLPNDYLPSFINPRTTTIQENRNVKEEKEKKEEKKDDNENVNEDDSDLIEHSHLKFQNNLDLSLLLKNLPGEIKEEDLKDEAKITNITKLDIYESFIESNNECVDEHKIDGNEGNCNNETTRFEFEQGYDYNRNIVKSRYDFNRFSTF